MIFQRTCKCCLGHELYKSRYRKLERLMNLVLLRPVRCGSCNRRWYKFLGVKAIPRGKRGYGSREKQEMRRASA